MITHMALAGAGWEVLAEIWQSATAEEAAGIIAKYGFGQVFDRIASMVSERAREYVQGKLFLGTVLTSLHGEILGCDQEAREIGGILGWKGLK